jgi:hypothetical protein
MSKYAKAMLAAVFLAVATSGGAGAATSRAPDLAGDANGGQHPSWLDGLGGTKLFAVDGSTIALSPTDKGLAREIAAPDGSVQTTQFTFIGDKLGTISDGADAKVIGFFRATDNGLEAEFADGHSESLGINAQGGVWIALKSPAGDLLCNAWYPSGHAFSLEERKAALAAYASRLGIDDPAARKSAAGMPQSSCARADAPPKPNSGTARRTASRTSGPNATMLAAAAKPTATSSLPIPTLPIPTLPINVRDSKVHPIDADADAAPSSGADTPQDTTGESGAVNCLSVDSDGAYWGFRNHCGFSVQFAYCLMNGSDRQTSCENGAVTGSVAAKGFGALLADESLKSTHADFDFRWVACGGGAGEVVPRLTATDPPAGRCLRSGDAPRGDKRQTRAAGDRRADARDNPATQSEEGGL